MDIFQLDTQHGLQRPQLEVETITTTFLSLFPVGYPGTGGVCHQDDLQGGHRGVLSLLVSGPTVLGSQKGLSGKTGDP